LLHKLFILLYDNTHVTQ